LANALSHTTEIKAFNTKGRSYTAKVVDRDVGRAKRQGTWELDPLPMLPILLSFSPPLSLFLLCARPDLFIPFSVAGSLSSPTSSLFLVLLPVFCFRKRQPLIYTLSLHRAESGEGAFAFNSLLPSCCYCIVVVPTVIAVTANSRLIPCLYALNIH